MPKITKSDIFVWVPRILFFAIALTFLYKYFSYLNAVVPFEYDWEPTDGDHLNFAHRLAQGLPIYLPLREGEVLSIYNPLYHGVVALLGGVHATLSFARTIAFFFWILIPVTVFFSYRAKWGWPYAALAALLIFMPAEPSMLIDIVQLNPNSTMGFLFLASMLYTNYCVQKNSANWYEWLLLGGITALCFLAKQQGLVALVITLCFLFIQKVQKQKLIIVMLGFGILVIASTVYLEIMNSGEYLRATLFDLHKIMITSSSLAKARLAEFLFKANIFFTACIAYTFYLAIKKDGFLNKFNVWEISFLIHIPFLLSILGNGGGGPNYFLSMWVSMVMICFEKIRDLDTDNKNKIKANLLLLGLLINTCFGINGTIKELNNLSLPTAEMNNIMRDYYRSVSELVANRRNLNILTHRNIGAFTATDVEIKNEGCTMFSYAWHFPTIFNKDAVLSQIRQKKFDFISTGLQEYPEEVQSEITKHYRPAISKQVNLYFGKLGIATVFVPKEN